MATIDQIQELVDRMERSLTTRFSEIDTRHTTLIQGLQAQFVQHEQRFLVLEQVIAQAPTPAVSPARAPVRNILEQDNRRKSRGFQLSLERYDGKPRSDLTTWIAQVEEKCALQNIPENEIGRWAKVHLDGNALAYISRLGIVDWTEIKTNLTHQFVPRHNNQLLRMQLTKLRQHGDIQNYVHEFQAILNRIEDEMATGDQLFYFINGLSNECRRYVELHQPTDLQSALDHCMNFEHVHTTGATSIPMELNFFNQRRFRNQNRSFNKFNRQPFQPSFNSNFSKPSWQNRKFQPNRSFSNNWNGRTRWNPSRFHSGQAPVSNNNGEANSTMPTFNGNRGRGRRFNSNRGFQPRFGMRRGGKVQFHMMDGLNSIENEESQDYGDERQTGKLPLQSNYNSNLGSTSENTTGSRAVGPRP